MNQLKHLINQLHQSIQHRKPHILVSSKIHKLSYIANYHINNNEKEIIQEIIQDIINLINPISNDRSVSSETIQIFSEIIMCCIDNNFFDQDDMDYLSNTFYRMKI